MFDLPTSLLVGPFLCLLMSPVAGCNGGLSVRRCVGVEHSDVEERSPISSPPKSTGSDVLRKYSIHLRSHVSGESPYQYVA